VLLLLALPGRLPAQPTEGPPQEKEPAETVEELHGKVALALNTGGHTEPIHVMKFTPDGEKLVTARGFEVRVWDVDTGRQVYVWRLPGGVGCLAVSPDGKTVAAAGATQVQADGKTRSAPVWLLPLKAGPAPGPLPEVIRFPWPGKGTVTGVTALAFSPDGTRLAWGAGYQAHVYDLKAKVVTHVIQPPADRRRGFVVRTVFSKDGNHLLTAQWKWLLAAPVCQVWDVRPPAQPGAKEEHPAAPLLVLAGSDEPWAAWSADNAHFAMLRAHYRHGLVVWSADGKIQRVFDPKLLEAEAGAGSWKANSGIHFLGNTDKVVAGIPHWEGELGSRQSGTVLLLDPQTGKVERLYRGPAQVAESFRTAVSPDGKLLAVTGDPGYEVILIDVETRKEVLRLGAPAPAPRFVGWGKDNRTIAWGFTLPAKKPRAAALVAGLNLDTLQPAGEEERKDLHPGEWNPDKWQISSGTIIEKKRDDKTGKEVARLRWGVSLVKPDGQRVETPIDGSATAWTFYKDSKDRQDRVVIGVAKDVYLYDPKANKVLHTLDTGSATRAVDVAVAPDGKHLLVAWGQQALQVFNIEDKPERVLNVLAVGEDWVAWTPQGYYAATPGGEKLIGWQVKHDDSTPLAFYPALRFRKRFFKPEVIRKVLEKGTPRTRGVEVEEVVPPTVKITEVKEIKNGDRTGLRIRAEAVAGSRGQPVQELRLLFDGRALAGVKAKQSRPDQAEWTIEELPGGQHELKVLARCADVSGASEPVPVTAPLPEKDKPLLYRVCVGINDYDQKELKLGSARQDAEAVFAALKACCTGKGNHFREAKGKTLPDKSATRQAVLDALQDARKAGVKAGDLLVVFFAGHGVVQKGEFYLLTREADTDRPLAGKSLSGEDLQKAFSELSCSVLLLMDACHSAAGVPMLRLKPATDDLTRSLTDDQAAVTVLAAAMGHETAGEQKEHGLFTQALLDGLKAGKGVPFDPDDHQMYVHHLYSHVFAKVRTASAGRQHPFLSMPWTVPPLAIRQLAKE
jgi:WD40 repeat protein